jgi:hypothetical protein
MSMHTSSTDQLKKLFKLISPDKIFDSPAEWFDSSIRNFEIESGEELPEFPTARVTSSTVTAGICLDVGVPWS